MNHFLEVLQESRVIQIDVRFAAPAYRIPSIVIPAEHFLHYELHIL
jgi:hypothetical protein